MEWKLVRPLKSVRIPLPNWGESVLVVKFTVRPLRGELEVFVSVIVWVVCAVFSIWAGKTTAAGLRVIGSWQAVVLFNPRHM